MDIKLVLAVLAILGLLGYLLTGVPGGVNNGSSAAGPRPPVISEIEFPQEISADGAEFDGAVHFSDPDGDLVEARFEVVDAALFQGFSIDLRGAADGITSGAIPFYLQTGVEQDVTLEVVLVDAQGQESEPVQFSFTAVAVVEEMPSDS